MGPVDFQKPLEQEIREMKEEDAKLYYDWGLKKSEDDLSWKRRQNWADDRKAMKENYEIEYVGATCSVGEVPSIILCGCVV